ncbi:hypothetical protein R6Q59_024227 [Mikania micrantha]
MLLHHGPPLLLHHRRCCYTTAPPRAAIAATAPPLLHRELKSPPSLRHCYTASCNRHGSTTPCYTTTSESTGGRGDATIDYRIDGGRGMRPSTTESAEEGGCDHRWRCSGGDGRWRWRSLRGRWSIVGAGGCVVDWNRGGGGCLRLWVLWKKNIKSGNECKDMVNGEENSAGSFPFWDCCS